MMQLTANDQSSKQRKDPINSKQLEQQIKEQSSWQQMTTAVNNRMIQLTANDENNKQAIQLTTNDWSSKQMNDPTERKGTKQ